MDENGNTSCYPHTDTYFSVKLFPISLKPLIFFFFSTTMNRIGYQPVWLHIWSPLLAFGFLGQPRSHWPFAPRNADCIHSHHMLDPQLSVMTDSFFQWSYTQFLTYIVISNSISHVQSRTDLKNVISVACNFWISLCVKS